MVYKSVRFVDGKARWVIVDENGNIVNRNPNKDELKGLDEEPRYPQDTRKKSTKYCDRCGISFDKVSGRPSREYDKEENWTGSWICKKCYMKDYNRKPGCGNDIKKLLRGVRTGNQNPNSSYVLGDNSLELACILYGWEDLNKKHDNYSTGTPIDCYDPKTGLYHQVQGRHYSSDYRVWPLGNFKREWEKKYETIVCFCIDEYGMTVERIYKFPKVEIDKQTHISIVKYDSKGNVYNYGWYEKYRIIDEEELKRANDIWKDIIGV